MTLDGQHHKIDRNSMSRYIPDLRSTYPVTKIYAPRGLREKQLNVKQNTETSEILKKLKPAPYVKPCIAQRLKIKEKRIATKQAINIGNMAIKEVARLKNIIKNQEPKKKASKYPEAPMYVKGMKSEFYSTREWRELRWKVVEASKGACVVCGRSNKHHGVILHVDHIKPRSKFPELELEQSNMQVLCEECNIGKRDRLQTF